MIFIPPFDLDQMAFHFVELFSFTALLIGVLAVVVIVLAGVMEWISEYAERGAK